MIGAGSTNTPLLVVPLRLSLLEALGGVELPSFFDHQVEYRQPPAQESTHRAPNKLFDARKRKQRQTKTTCDQVNKRWVSRYKSARWRSVLIATGQTPHLRGSASNTRVKTCRGALLERLRHLSLTSQCLMFLLACLEYNLGKIGGGMDPAPKSVVLLSPPVRVFRLELLIVIRTLHCYINSFFWYIPFIS